MNFFKVLMVFSFVSVGFAEILNEGRDANIFFDFPAIAQTSNTRAYTAFDRENGKNVKREETKIQKAGPAKSWSLYRICKGRIKNQEHYCDFARSLNVIFINKKTLELDDHRLYFGSNDEAT